MDFRLRIHEERETYLEYLERLEKREEEAFEEFLILDSHVSELKAMGAPKPTVDDARRGARIAKAQHDNIVRAILRAHVGHLDFVREGASLRERSIA